MAPGSLSGMCGLPVLGPSWARPLTMLDIVWGLHPWYIVIVSAVVIYIVGGSMLILVMGGREAIIRPQGCVEAGGVVGTTVVRGTIWQVAGTVIVVGVASP